MKVDVIGIVELEVTDPQGLCNQGRPVQLTPVNPQIPTGITPVPVPVIPLPDLWRDKPLKRAIYRRDISSGHKWPVGPTGDPAEAVNHNRHHEKWGRGMSAALRAGKEDNSSGNTGHSYQA